MAIGGGVWIYLSWDNKRKFNKIIHVCEIVGVNFVPTFKDTAKTVKIGTGGFEILYLKKSKTWKIGYGGRVGKKDYYFFIMPDGYWYNGMLSANMYTVDKEKGMIPIVTTNPNMRSQYTALEKQIDALHKDKQSFMEKYGAWILAIGFVLVAGVMLWLNYQEYSKAMATQITVVDKIGNLIDRINVMSSNNGGAVVNGLIPVK